MTERRGVSRFCRAIAAVTFEAGPTLSVSDGGVVAPSSYVLEQPAWQP
ncbi:MAG TPA: hypothetical protein VFK39_02320 [Gemmatimonadaceae bacterium]|nr:hypothetical protein [Gemmatimonadaceae bacterium]